MVEETQHHPNARGPFSGRAASPLASGAFRPFGIRTVRRGARRVPVEESVDAVFGAGQLRCFRAVCFSRFPGAAKRLRRKP